MMQGVMKDWLTHIEDADIHLDDCDLDDKTCYVPCYSDLEPLKASILAVGIVNKPIVRPNAKGHWIPVLGRRRLLAARAIGLEAVKAGILGQHVSDSLCYEAAFWENLSHRLFEAPTKALVVYRLLQLFPRQEVASRFLPLLGIPPSGPRLKALTRIAQLEPEIHVLMASGRLNEKTAILLSHLAREDRGLCMNLISRLRPNVNKSAELISGLFDFAVHHELTVKAVLDLPEMRIIIDGIEGYASSDVTNAMRSLLRRLIYPDLSIEETQFSEWLDEQRLPSNVTIRPSQAFEDKTCTVEIKVDSREKAMDLVRTVVNTHSI